MIKLNKQQILHNNLKTNKPIMIKLNKQQILHNNLKTNKPIMNKLVRNKLNKLLFDFYKYK